MMVHGSVRIIAKVLLVGIICAGGCIGLRSPVGWRTDGTGTYPKVHPPLNWSDQDHVLWATRMPGWSNSTPIIVGDKLFVCSEPTSLVCLRVSDGAILWQQDNSTLELLPPAQAESVREHLEQAEPFNEKLQNVKKRVGRLKRKMKKEPDNDSLAKEIQVLRDRQVELEDQLSPLDEHILNGKAHPVRGFSSATPVSDGRHVFVVFGNAVVACYDLHGDRQWIRRVDPWIGGHSTSPLLVGDKLLVHAENLVALDKATGEELWRIVEQRRCGTPVHTRIGNVDVIATANGDLIRVEDGHRLADGLGRLKYNSPIVRDGLLCYSQAETLAWKLPGGGTTFIPELLWEARIKQDRYYASPVYHEGLVYSMTRKNVLSVIDAGKGQLVYEKKLDLGKGDAFPSISVAGGHVFVSNSNGTTLVFKAGRTHEPVAKNELEEFRSSLVFIGDRLYVRGLNHMFCIVNDRSVR